MSKNIIDAVNEFKGEWPECGFFAYRGNEPCIVMAKATAKFDGDSYEKGVMYVGGSKCDSNHFVVMCVEQEFNDLVSQMETNFGKVTHGEHYDYVHDDKVLLTKSDKELEVMDILSPKEESRIEELENALNEITRETEYEACYDIACHQLDLSTTKPQPKPVFTQEMCDNGELPSVGMEFLMKHKDADESWAQPDFHPAKMKAIGDELFIIESLSECNRLKESVGTIDDYLFKPLTPPIELIDGKAYQFDYDGDTFQGIYSERGDDFHSNKFVSSAPICTNIEPLTVGVK